MTIRVANQTRPVPFTVHAVVTTSDIEFDVTDVDFDHCTIYEAVHKTVKLTNKSILSQRFGFVGIPEVDNKHTSFCDVMLTCSSLAVCRRAT